MKSRVATALCVLPLLLAPSCGPGGGGGGGAGAGGSAFFVEACNLGCGNGLGGAQVACAIVNVFRNQEIAVTFSQQVDLNSADPATFRVVDANTGLSADGGYSLDPNNPRRVIFRPSLDFDPNGNPLFGFDDGGAYLIRISGTAQGDPGPYVRSVGGAANQSRVLCQITTDQGISDAVPGPPTASVFVEINNVPVPASGTAGVDLDTPITFVFNDVMNVATLRTVMGNPPVGQSPFIRVLVDLDGDLTDPSDQVVIPGDFAQPLVDQANLRTEMVFTANGGLPSAGSNMISPRQIVVRMPSAVSDLAGNSLANAGDITFVPAALVFMQTTITEDFTTETQRDLQRTGASWGPADNGGGVNRLTPSIGGGSGRLGDLRIPANTTRTIIASPTIATGFVEFGNPENGDSIVLGGVTFSFTTGAGGGTNIKIQPTVFITLVQLIEAIENPANGVMGVTVSIGTIETDASRGRLLITNNTSGTPGNPGGANEFAYDGIPAAMSATVFGFPVGSPTNMAGELLLFGAVDGETFPAGDLIDNTDFSMGVPPLPPIMVGDGIFEFSSIVIEPNARLRIISDVPARLYSRGQFTIDGFVDICGSTPPQHRSDSPQGQFGAPGGPFGSPGGQGSDRPDNASSGGPTGLLSAPTGDTGGGFDNFGFFVAGIVNPGASIVGRNGMGVGRMGFTFNGGGQGGAQWPTGFPPAANVLAGLETTTATHDLDPALECVSAQVGSPGGGGAFSSDGAGGMGMAKVAVPTTDVAETNAPPPSTGTNAIALSGADRTLNPDTGDLRGGAGGGGGGSTLEYTQTDEAQAPNCLSGSITHYRSHSASGGGGAGGTAQCQAGRELAINGTITADGGAGGSFLSLQTAMQAFPSRSASPGGGGSAGSVLAQSRTVSFPPMTAGRVSILGGSGGVGKDGSLGGDGGNGLVRIECVGCGALPGSAFASAIAPFDPMDPNSSTLLSVGEWTAGQAQPSTFSGATSCWYRPAGAFFTLDFLADDEPNLGDLGWDMNVIFDAGGGMTTTSSYRTPNPGMGNMSLQEVYGDLLGVNLGMGQVAAPIVVRFQGAKTNGPLPTPCIADINDAGNGLEVGSVTPWVRHPSELDQFNPRPDAIRFAVIFDPASTNFPGIIGIDLLRIEAQPE